MGGGQGEVRRQAGQGRPGQGMAAGRQVGGAAARNTVMGQQRAARWGRTKAGSPPRRPGPILQAPSRSSSGWSSGAPRLVAGLHVRLRRLPLPPVVHGGCPRQQARRAQVANQRRLGGAVVRAARAPAGSTRRGGVGGRGGHSARVGLAGQTVNSKAWRCDDEQNTKHERAPSQPKADKNPQKPEPQAQRQPDTAATPPPPTTARL